MCLYFFFQIYNLTFQLFPGHDTGKTAKEMMLYISTAVTNKVQNILKNGSFFSILCDGSQARKTKHDKEMVLTRTERKGIFLFVVVIFQHFFFFCYALFNITFV